MNEVSIIINGVRYDAVDGKGSYCECCDMNELCSSLFDFTCAFSGMCENGLGEFCCPNNLIFKKSDKKFER
ncbi:MAG: hypothetical protein II304_09765 [Bacteroidales bacterium]|nr:hypothetical protein [Bacteroidales bacterium]